MVVALVIKTGQVLIFPLSVWGGSAKTRPSARLTKNSGAPKVVKDKKGEGMKGFKRLAVALGLIGLVFGPAVVSAQEGSSDEFITWTVTTSPGQTEGFVELNFLWTAVEGAASYDLHLGPDIIASEDNSEVIGVRFDSGDLEIEIIAYGPGNEELARSRKTNLNLPGPGSKYTGEGSITLKSEYTYSFPDGGQLDGREDGAIGQFFICQVEGDDGNGNKVLADFIYGTGWAAFMDNIDGVGYTISITGRGKFDIFGNLNKVPVPKEGADCSMSVRLTTSYPVVYQEICVAGAGCQKLPYFDWEESHVIEVFPTKALTERETTKTVYEVVTKINKYTLDTIYIAAPPECRSYK